MIKSFRCKETQKVWNGIRSKKFSLELQERALIKLRLLDAAITLSDLRVPPGNRLEHLKGDRSQEMSIRITQQWRLCFVWEHGEAYEVEIIDYH